MVGVHLSPEGWGIYLANLAVGLQEALEQCLGGSDRANLGSLSHVEGTALCKVLSDGGFS